MKKRLFVAFLLTLTVAVGCGKKEKEDKTNEKETVNVELGDKDEPEDPAVKGMEDETVPESEEVDEPTVVEDEPSFAVEDQIAVIVANKDTWFKESDFDTYCYAITDLDQDGHIELVVSSCQGSGIFTYSDFYEVNDENSLTRVEYTIEEGSSEPDIIKDEIVCYYEPTMEAFYYMVNDVIRNGAAETYMINYAMAFGRDDTIELDLIASYSQLFYDNPDGDFIYEDKDGNEITEEEYNNIEDSLFADFDKMTCHINWIAGPDYDNDFEQLLLESWEGFGIN